MGVSRAGELVQLGRERGGQLGGVRADRRVRHDGAGQAARRSDEGDRQGHPSHHLRRGGYLVRGDPGDIGQAGGYEREMHV
jgi:hypothetical protein